MTIEEVIAILAERDSPEMLAALAYTASRDALDPILHKLVERERNKLLDILCDQIADGTTGDPDLWELVAMPPYKLATAIAEAIVACRKETKNERGNGEP